MNPNKMIHLLEPSFNSRTYFTKDKEAADNFAKQFKGTVQPSGHLFIITL